MWSRLILISGGLFAAAMLATGVRQRLAGAGVKGRPPIFLPLFLLGKAAMGLLWMLALWRAAASLSTPAVAGSWPAGAGALVFAAGSAVALAAFAALGLETRFGLPQGACRLKTGGLYAWSRHPMYTGFYLMGAGACLFAFNAASLMLFPVAVWVHHRVALAEERFMARRFGAAWEDYARRVGRYASWPGLSRGRRTTGVSDPP